MLVPPLCWGCGGPARRREPLCLGCTRGLRRLPVELVSIDGLCAWAPLAYEGAARELVRALKFRGALRVADAMAAQIAANAPAGLWGPALGPAPGGAAPLGPAPARPPLVPVPLHHRRRRRRGFNQAGLLADALSVRTGLPVEDCLERRGDGGSQVGRGRRERRELPRGVVTIRAGPAPARAILVDDVVTTGGTLAACATALREAGGEEVMAVAYARTLGR